MIPDTDELIHRLDQRLTASGQLTDDTWREALYGVPRHLFVSRKAWCARTHDSGYPIERDARPAEWWEAAYGDATIVMTGQGQFAAFLAAPALAIDFLERLDVDPGDRVLEIGTGPGWTAAMLCARLGDDAVTSIEVDPRTAAQAMGNLESAGYAPTLGTGDGAAGHAPNAPYDRLHVTRGVRTVPPAWLAQARPGALIVFPWTAGLGCDHKVRLSVTHDGSAIGRFHGGCSSMPFRSRLVPYAAEVEDYRESVADLHPRRLIDSPYGAAVALSAALPDVTAVPGVTDDGGYELWLTTANARAHVRRRPADRRTLVFQAGARDLWDEAEDAFFRWVALGHPAGDRFGLTVTPDGQRIWLDRPDRVIAT